jgi:hypothetical protein
VLHFNGSHWHDWLNFADVICVFIAVLSIFWQYDTSRSISLYEKRPHKGIISLDLFHPFLVVSCAYRFRYLTLLFFQTQQLVVTYLHDVIGKSASAIPAASSGRWSCLHLRILYDNICSILCLRSCPVICCLNIFVYASFHIQDHCILCVPCTE